MNTTSGKDNNIQTKLLEMIRNNELTKYTKTAEFKERWADQSLYSTRNKYSETDEYPVGDETLMAMNRVIMKSLGLRPGKGVFVLTDYVLEQIFGPKPVARYTSPSDNQPSSDISSAEMGTEKPRKKSRILSSSDENAAVQERGSEETEPQPQPTKSTKCRKKKEEKKKEEKQQKKIGRK